MMEPLDDLVSRWVAGWAVSRSMAIAPVDGVDRAWRVEVAAESRSVEYVAASPSADDLGQLVRLISGHADHWLTVGGPVGSDPFVDLERITHVEEFMVAPITASSSADSVIVEVEGAVALARVEIDGALAASGQVAVVGQDAIVDRVRTEDAFRRRGLGRDIMTALTGWAAQRGAVHGLLLASQDGVQLYRPLGWSYALPAVTYSGAPLATDLTQN